MSRNISLIIGTFAIFAIFFLVFLSGHSNGYINGPEVNMNFQIRAEFILFALTLVGVAVLHNYTMQVALTGLASIIILKFSFVTDFSLWHHMFGGHHPILSEFMHKDFREGEWPTILNLLGLLLGFALLAKHFEASKVPEYLPKVLPKGWVGGFVLLLVVCVISSFLDNIAAAMIGGTIALVVFKGKVDIGYLAAIVAASNAGGAGSVLGDTTTTMIWIDGVSPFDVLHAYAAAIPAVIICGIIAAKQQDKFQPIQLPSEAAVQVDYKRLVIVAMILVGAISTNFLMDLPFVGVWIAILIGATFSKTAWSEIPGALKGTIFLLSLVMCASLMPVDKLPAPSPWTALSLGFISAVFDNIPLTKLTLEQGGYDWGFIAYAVGFGGSMIWFGSSAGVALSNMFPQAKSVGAYLKHGWHVTVAYVIGFFIMYYTLGWHPHAAHRKEKVVPAAKTELEVK